jgi:hypothetical protein
VLETSVLFYYFHNFIAQLRSAPRRKKIVIGIPTLRTHFLILRIVSPLLKKNTQRTKTNKNKNMEFGRNPSVGLAAIGKNVTRNGRTDGRTHGRTDARTHARKRK